jgi:hypothetical protein
MWAHVSVMPVSLGPWAAFARPAFGASRSARRTATYPRTCPRRRVVMRRALPDLRETEMFDGYVVRVPWPYGQNGDEIRALRYYAADVHEGQVVRVTMTPRMRHVIRVDAVRGGGSARTDGQR